MSKAECMKIEKKLAFHSAPSLLGVKCANLVALNHSEFDIESYAELFNCKGRKYDLQFRILCSCKERTLILIYNEKLLENRLNNKIIQHFLHSYGYHMNCSLHYYLKKLSERISCYDEFPHEIGAFLDYPYEDIVGFIANKGKNFKICGCWKVYGDTATAKRTFSNYDKCRNYLCYKLNSGIDIFNAIQEVYLS